MIYNDVEYLTLPQQVQKSKDDICYNVVLRTSNIMILLAIVVIVSMGVIFYAFGKIWSDEHD